MSTRACFITYFSGSISLHAKSGPSKIARQRDGGVGSTVAINRFLFQPHEVDTNSQVILPPTDFRAAHVHNVLQLSNGAAVRAAVVDQYLYDQVPIHISPDASVTFLLEEALRKQPPAQPRITLLLALPRPKVLARLIPQICAIGIRDLVVCNAYKVERCYFDSSLLTKTHEMEALLMEGVSQCGIDSRLPNIFTEKRLKVFLEDRLPGLCTPNSKLLLAEPGSKQSLLQTLLAANEAQSEDCSGNHIVLAIGPEGGWMPREVSMFQNAFNFTPVSIGDRILRTDAAVLITLGVVHEFIRVRENKV